MSATAVVLLSGGLDSMLAVRVLQAQGLKVEALTFQTLFTCCQSQASLAARELGVRLTVVGTDDDYLELVRRPQFGYGRGANPCLDCRIYMFRRAAQFMQQVEGALVASGEVVGQRPMSQKKRDLLLIAHHAGLDDVLLRPLSALLLPATRAQREGLVDRRRLYGFSGRSRKGLIELARRLGITRIPGPSTGCALTEPEFAVKVHDLIAHGPGQARWDFELVKLGRHVRIDAATKVVIGRREEENARLVEMFRRSDRSPAALLEPQGFAGPTALVVGRADLGAIDRARQLVLERSRPRAGLPVPAAASPDSAAGLADRPDAAAPCGAEAILWIDEHGAERLLPLVEPRA